MNYLDPDIWGPHFWFFLNTIAVIYPKYPNAVTKKKYYDFIQNLPLFIPNEKISADFERLINKYPISPYLDNRKSIVKWVHFIHNKINTQLEKPSIDITDFYNNYYENYKTRDEKQIYYQKLKQNIFYVLFCTVILALIYYCYNIH